jgi:hypothetical protein
MLTAETIISSILPKISGIGKCQKKFFLHIVLLFLSLRTRYNFCSFARSGVYCEQSYRNQFAQAFPFQEFNLQLIQKYCGKDLVLIFDPSHISKSGKHTPGVGKFWSGCAQAMKHGLELSEIAVADIENHTAMHYHATLTDPKEDEDLLTYYARIICEQSEKLQQISKVTVFDAYFSKKKFVDSICAKGFTMVSRLQKNIYLRCRYTGDQHKGRGAKKIYGDKVDVKNLSEKDFTLIGESENRRVYEGVAHVRSLKRWCKIVIVHTLKDGVVESAIIYFSTDVTMRGLRICEIYGIRFQIEFLHRDSKQFLGLTQCQSRQKSALNYHFNISLTTLNIAKIIYWLDVPKAERTTFSMADIKTKYINEFILDQIILIYGKDPLVEKNKPEIMQLYQLGRIAA